VVAIGSDGGRPLFSWGFGALEGSADLARFVMP
jgi:hypothetical protein